VQLPDIGNVQTSADVPLEALRHGGSIGQSFVSHHAGLCRVELTLSLEERPGEPVHKLDLVLRRGSPQGEKVAQVQVVAKQMGDRVRYAFAFHPQNDSLKATYYLEVRGEGEGRVSLWASSTDAYPDGSLYLDGHPVPGDLAFRTYYEYSLPWLLSDLLEGATRWAWLVPATFLILLVPGVGLLWLTGILQNYHLPESLALGVGMSIAFEALCFLLLSLLPVPLLWSSGAAAVLAVILAIWLAAHRRYTGQERGTERWADERTSYPWASGASGSVLFCLALLGTLAVRYLHAKGAAGPAWVDSVQHAMIAQLFLQQAGLPQSYMPYLPLTPFTYHFGFHGAVALLHWLSGLDVSWGVLVVGQALDTLVAASVYLLTLRLTRDRLAALVAMIATGLVSVMPAYYVSWGRYTQLAGLVVMPVAIVLTMDALSENARRVHLLVAGIAVAGLYLVHPRVAVFYLAWAAAHLLTQCGASTRRQVLRVLGRLFVVASVSIALLAPWLWRTLVTMLFPLFQRANATPAEANAFPWGYITAGHDSFLLALALVGLIAGLVHRRSWASLVLVWTALLVAVGDPSLLSLPGRVMVSNGAVAISLFVQVSILIGGLMSLVAEKLAVFRWPLALKGAVVGALLAAGLVGGRDLLPIANPTTWLLSAYDRDAIAWVEANTALGSRFVINGTPWALGVYVGSDGGYWLPVLAQRFTQIPPVTYGFGPEVYVRSVNEEAAGLGEKASSGRALAARMRELGYSYVFLGTRGGPLSKLSLEHDPSFEVVYANPGAKVLHLKANLPSQANGFPMP